MGNKEVEQKAIEYVMDWEKKKGRNPQEVSKCGYDIKSGERCIEVKGRSGGYDFVLLNYKNIEAMRREDNFWLYIVYFDKDTDGNLTFKKLNIFNKQEIEERAKKREQWEIPVRKSDTPTQL